MFSEVSGLLHALCELTEEDSDERKHPFQGARRGHERTYEVQDRPFGTPTDDTNQRVDYARAEAAVRAIRSSTHIPSPDPVVAAVAPAQRQL